LPVPVRLDLKFLKNQKNGDWALNAMTARLAPPTALDPNLFVAGVEEIWGPLWEVQRVEVLTDLSRAGHAAETLGVLEVALREKAQSPVAAAIGAALLLRASNLDRLHDWPKNLANRFPWLPDGPILWAETLIRRDEALQREEQAWHLVPSIRTLFP